MALNISGWEANMLSKGAQYKVALAAATVGTDAALILYYYDAAQVLYQIGDYTGDSSYYTAAEKAIQIYRDGYANAPGVNYAAAGYWNFTTGLRMHWQRTGDAASKAAVIGLSLNAAFATDWTTNASLWDPDGIDNDGGSREAAYAFRSHLDAELCGAARRPRTLELATVMLHHLDVFALGLASPHFVRPFMVGLTCEQVIRGVQAGIIDETVAKTKMNAVFAYLETLYHEYDASSAYHLYGDRVYQNPAEDMLPAPDLGMLISPAMLYAGTYAAHAETIFNGTVAHGWLGDGSTQMKQFNQTYKWSFQQVAGWGSSGTPGTGTGGDGDTGSGSAVVLPVGNLRPCIPTIWSTPTSRLVKTSNQVVPPGGTGVQPNPPPVAPPPQQFPTFDVEGLTGLTKVFLQDFTDTTKPKNASAATAVNNDVIATMNDSSVNGYNLAQSNNAYRAILKTNVVNGLQVARFDGTKGFEIPIATASAITKNRAGLTIYLVAKLSAISGANQDIIRTYVGANERLSLVLVNTTGQGQYRSRAQDANSLSDIASNASYHPVAGTWYVWLWKFNYAGNKLKVWQNSIVTVNDVSIGSSGNSSNTDVSGADGQTLYFNDYGAVGMQADIGEFGILNGSITDLAATNFINAVGVKYQFAV